MNSWQVRCGDVRETLKTLPANSVQTCVTSPPYWGLRDYGTATWEGGAADCDHRHARGGEGEASAIQTGSVGTQTYQYRDICGTCGATRLDAQIGLEATPDAYVATMVEVFREVRRILKNDGTVWLNLGDSYASAPAGNESAKREIGNAVMSQNTADALLSGARRNKVVGGLKPKDLVGIPWRVAFALQADGWYLRADIIWHKPNPMPESVTDRPTKAHEYLFLLTKSPQYYYDADLIAEPIAEVSKHRYQHAVDTNEQFDPSHHKHTEGVQSPMELLTRAAAGVLEKGTRNKRSVWTVATQSYEGAHFATFPPALIEPCILAGSRVGDTVFDPFTGSGTTGAVALAHSRNFLGLELNPEYVELARTRLAATAPLFAEEVTEVAPAAPVVSTHAPSVMDFL